MEYQDVFELLRAVGHHELKKGETIIPSNSEKGTHVGFCTADGEEPSIRWVISVKNLERSCRASSAGLGDVYHRMRFFHTRRGLLEDVLSGKVPVEPSRLTGGEDDE